MKRKRTNYDYFRKTIENSCFGFKGCDKRFIFVSDEDKPNIEKIVSKSKTRFEYIKRNEKDKIYKPLIKFKQNSYDYWRSHLCLDFVYSMSVALKRCKSDYIMWLEDDVILTNKVEICLQLANSKMVNFHHGNGFCCMAFDRHFLRKLIEFIKANCMKDMPLDYMPHMIGVERPKSIVKCAYNHGIISSRRDSLVKRDVDQLFFRVK